MAQRSCLFDTVVRHVRTGPTPNRFAYRLSYLYLDLDEIGEIDQRLRLFGHNRRAPIAINDADHGDGQSALRPWVDRQLAQAGLVSDGTVSMLCLPRVLGFVFNPLTVYFSHDRDGRLQALLLEVANAHRERHTYVLPVATTARPDTGFAKEFFVSPFMPMALRYRLAATDPDDQLALTINAQTGTDADLVATMRGTRRELDDRALARLLVRTPHMTVAVVARILRQALRLWLMGAPRYRRTPMPPRAVSFVPPSLPIQD